MKATQAAAAAGRAVEALGDGFGTDPRTLRRARQLGLTGWAFQVAGRGGALGDVDAATVSDAIGFFAPDAVREGWEAARRVISPGEVARQSLAECCRWGESRLEQFYALPRLVSLAQRVVDSAGTDGLPLFAAWRAAPVPDESLGARTAALCYLLREHRLGTLLLAVRASGLTPLQAVLAGPGGRAAAQAAGWLPPYPCATSARRHWSTVQELADRLSGDAYQVLTGAERAELGQLLDEAAELVAMPRRY